MSLNLTSLRNSAHQWFRRVSTNMTCHQTPQGVANLSMLVSMLCRTMRFQRSSPKLDVPNARLISQSSEKQVLTVDLKPKGSQRD